ncbi:AAA family ATPase [Arthrobacter sp. NPDC056886]|uniref:AAA family ATPase n=1 Tax=Arthrobacter sp. NPDC056886 TaxID=3345960 RepID=UPI00366BEC95
MVFKLLSVNLVDQHDTGDEVDPAKILRDGISFAAQPHPDDVTGSITGVIGKNGTGKSLLLRSIAEAFLRLEELARGKSKSLKPYPVSRIEYLYNNHHCVIQSNASGVRFYVDHANVALENLPRPSCVVALTNSPFDKFPLEKSQTIKRPSSEQSSYHYLGLRDRSGRASIENLMYRSLNALFEQGEEGWMRYEIIQEIFAFLGLEPRLAVVYTAKISARVEQAVAENKSVLIDGVIHDTRTYHRTVETADSHDLADGELNELLALALEYRDMRKIRSETRFETGARFDSDFRKLQILRRAGFLQLSAIEIFRGHGPRDLKNSSSGELSLVGSLIALASVIENDALVLIDEPELSLHPEWQMDYISLILRAFAMYRGCHFVIATHSPLVISELPSRATVVGLDRRDLPSTGEVAGESSDLLLAEMFGLPTANNLYVKECILQVLQMAADGLADTDKFWTELHHIEKLGAEMAEEDPARVIIQSLRVVGDLSRKKHNDASC